MLPKCVLVLLQAALLLPIGAVVADDCRTGSRGKAVEQQKSDVPESGVKEPAGIELDLRIAVRPPTDSQPARLLLVGTVANNTAEPISFAGFPGGDVTVVARHRWPLELRRIDKPAPLEVVVAAGARQVIFELPLDEILAQRPGKSAGDDLKWAWDWKARARPPASPLFRDSIPSESGEFTTAEEISIRFELELHGQSYESNSVELSVQGAQPDADRPRHPATD